MRWKQEAHRWGRRRVQPQSPDKASYESQRAAWEPGTACPASSPAVSFRVPPWTQVPSPARPKHSGRLTGLEQLDLDLWVPLPAPFPLDHSHSSPCCLCLEGCLSRHPQAHCLKSLFKCGLLLESPPTMPRAFYNRPVEFVIYFLLFAVCLLQINVRFTRARIVSVVYYAAQAPRMPALAGAPQVPVGG